MDARGLGWDLSAAGCGMCGPGKVKSREARFPTNGKPKSSVNDAALTACRPAPAGRAHRFEAPALCCWEKWKTSRKSGKLMEKLLTK